MSSTGEAHTGGTAPLIPDHEYDGIQEYDNPTPGWWHLIWFGTIVFSVGYWVVYEMGDALPGIQEICAAEQNAENQRLFAALGELKPDEPTIARLMGQERWMSLGSSIFRANCASCHGSNGEGNVGPNMTDDSYKNIAGLADFPKVIREGAANLAMPAWKGRLNENEIVLVSAYAATLRGKNLPGKSPEGQPAAPWPVVPASPAGGGEKGAGK